MAKLNAPASSLQRSDVLKVRRRALVRQNRGTVIVQAWPRERGKPKSELQQAWVDRFSCLARALKSPPPWALDAAKGWAQQNQDLYAGPKGQTGWYYRDVLESAANGKLIRYQGEPKIRTPTVQVRRPSVYPMTAGQFAFVPITELVWDNNSFWSPNVNPSRLTFKSAGLYLIGATALRQTTGTGYWSFAIYQAGADPLTGVRIPSTAAAQYANLTTLAYFHANDYIELALFNQSGNVNYTILNFWAVAITPENLIP